MRSTTWWVELGCPDPFTLVEMGAGDGTRAAGLPGRRPGMPDRLALRAGRGDDPVLRDRQRVHLPIESPIFVLGPVGPVDHENDDPDDDEPTPGPSPASAR